MKENSGIIKSWGFFRNTKILFKYVFRPFILHYISYKKDIFINFHLTGKLRWILLRILKKQSEYVFEIIIFHYFFSCFLHMEINNLELQNNHSHRYYMSLLTCYCNLLGR